VDRYYYLASTLQTPVFGQKPPLSFDDLKQLCGRLAADDDLLMLESLSIAPPEAEEGARRGASAFLSLFWRRERALRSEIAQQRAERLGRRAELPAGGPQAWDGDAQVSAKRALAAEDPLQAELSLEKDRWDWIDARSAGHRFDAEALAAYGLKLLILERLGRFSEEAGMERYESMYRTILAGSDKLPAFGDGSWTGNGEARNGPD
jgi:hypothetical protein